TAGSSDTCYSRKCFRWGEHLRAGPGVNGPPHQTIIVIVKSYYTVLLPNTMVAKEIHEDSCGRKGLGETPEERQKGEAQQPAAGRGGERRGGMAIGATADRA